VHFVADSELSIDLDLESLLQIKVAEHTGARDPDRGTDMADIEWTRSGLS
jgi:hypothetical protein